MLSTSIQYAKELFLQIKGSTLLPVNPRVEQQIQCESNEGVEEGMVSTRSQDPRGSNETLVTKESALVQSRKRKARHEVDVNSRGSHTKRRRNATATENDSGAIDYVSTDVNDQTRSDTNAEDFLGVLVPGRPGDVRNIEATQQAIEIASVNEAAGPTQSVRSNDSQIDLTSKLENQDSSENEVDKIKTTKAVHKRFGSEEAELQSAHLEANITPEIQTEQPSEEKFDSHSDEASEDDAPETVTAVDGFKQAHAAAANAAKTIERKVAQAKQKRKERDALLNSQAKSARKRDIIEADQPKTSPKSKNKVMENDLIGDEANPKAALSLDTPLPTFLPESILLAEPPSSLPIPPSALSKPKKKPKDPLAAKRKLLGLNTKPPKDVKHGSRVIRVLQTDRISLPPRASPSSKALREAWLAGRRGGSLSEPGSVPRRKVGGGFVRK